jgi:hypothetical protein
MEQNRRVENSAKKLLGSLQLDIALVKLWRVKLLLRKVKVRAWAGPIFDKYQTDLILL